MGEMMNNSGKILAWDKLKEKNLIERAATQLSLKYPSCVDEGPNLP